jgi:murein DD-endopeptidase MepM/ murein hydrolase activator NlpD
MFVRKLFILICVALWHLPSVNATEIAPPPQMIVPVECEIGWNCWIVNYVDHERSDGVKDYACGNQTTNGHKGTDFMIRNYRDMQGGVIVRAVVDGTVVGSRDQMKDIDFRKIPKERIAKKECGNGVRIDHGEGWFTQYCHMRKNSVRVKKGDAVKQGDILGFVGSSGKAAVPHLHFRVDYVAPNSGKRRGAVVDPFVGVARKNACEAGENALWPRNIVESMPYRQIDIFDMGFSSAKPKDDGLVQGLYDDETLSIRSPRLFLWGRFLHVKKGDRLTYIIKGPDGGEVLNYTNTIEKDEIYRTLHAGVRRPALNWEEGTYYGYIKLVRADDKGGRIYESEATISLR